MELTLSEMSIFEKLRRMLLSGALFDESESGSDASLLVNTSKYSLVDEFAKVNYAIQKNKGTSTSKLHIDSDKLEKRRISAIKYLNYSIPITTYHPYVMYNTPIQLFCSIKSRYSLIHNRAPLEKNFLSCFIPENIIGSCEYPVLCTGCPVTVNPYEKKTRRNMFTFVHIREDRSGECVCFEDDVLIQLFYSGYHKKLCLRCNAIEEDDVIEDYFPVTLTSTPDEYCYFVIKNGGSSAPVDDSLVPVLPSSEIILYNAITDRFLTAYTETITTDFGYEHPVTCRKFYIENYCYKKCWNIISQPNMDKLSTQENEYE